MKTNTVRAREICNELRHGAVLCKGYSSSRRTVEDYVTLKLYEAEQRGWATRAYPADELEEKTLEQAQRIAALPPDIVQLNKRAVHRQMSVMGLREGIRQGTELCTLATHQPSFHEFISQVGQGAGKLTSALQRRDEKFGDYRTQKKK